MYSGYNAAAEKKYFEGEKFPVHNRNTEYPFNTMGCIHSGIQMVSWWAV